eukprot:scaffold371_cov268-Chaetoceros_neogracile.AAC.21
MEAMLHAIELPPSPQPWDDFLDFSRMKPPGNFWTVRCRISRNCIAPSRFKGNYMAIWFFAITFAGLFMNCWYFLISLGFLSGFWTLLCISTINPEYLYARSLGINVKMRKYNGIANQRVSLVLENPNSQFVRKAFVCEILKFLTISFQHIVLAALGHLGMLIIGMLIRIYMISLLVGFIIFAHAISRPVALELMRKKVPKVLAKDGFLDEADPDCNDEDGEEETLVFSVDTHMPVSSHRPKKSTDISNTERNHRSCKRRKSNLIVPMAKEEVGKEIR